MADKLGTPLDEEMVGRLRSMLRLTKAKPIPSSLLTRLERVNELVSLGSPVGELRSTQVIAAIVEQWERDHPGNSLPG